MTTVTFDTLELADRLAKSHEELVTKRDLQAELAPIKWGVAVTVGGIVTLILKAFFPA
ncbi:MAG: hypothetical protein G8345_10470 [Magnetococcales bacterium]|nr:hypothetical protein [Magnetococcales bacterium]NGZ27296.1 hypothetical protein [Magnetococcales bacterium]